ncbi:serine/threonine dehydratase family protein PWA37_004462 [Arxiozyma heterogenica]|uniref:serine/threonine dehydratase family protein n=1 Tax=Arxiozyma heterogenica TaxID=278026 RepID=UPI002F0B3DD2
MFRFKIRGIGNLILQSTLRIQNEKKKSPQVFSSSGGNAGFAAATASQRLSLPCTVVVPKTTKQRLIEKIKSTGANVIVKGNHWKEADTYLKSEVMKNINESSFEPIYVHPFDDPVIWEGHSTMVDEILYTLKEQQVAVDNVKGIVCSVGGGGLYNGIIRGLEKHQLTNRIPVIAVETIGCNVLNVSLKENKEVVFDKITSIATSLGSTTISRKTFEYAQKYSTKSVAINDVSVVETCLRYAKDFNMIAEPAMGASLHMAYNKDLLEQTLGHKLTPDDVIIIIACGGSSSTIQELEEALDKLKEQTTEIPAYKIANYDHIHE